MPALGLGCVKLQNRIRLGPVVGPTNVVPYASKSGNKIGLLASVTMGDTGGRIAVPLDGA
jgi:hypothetical protein